VKIHANMLIKVRVWLKNPKTTY